MAADWERMDAIDKSLAMLKQNMKELGESRAVYGAVINDADDALEAWEVGRFLTFRPLISIYRYLRDAMYLDKQLQESKTNLCPILEVAGTS